MRRALPLLPLLVLACRPDGASWPEDTGPDGELGDAVDVEPPEDVAADAFPEAVDAADSEGATPEDAAADAQDADAGDSVDVATGPCPSGMALVDDRFCIDRHEGALEERAPDGTWSPASPYLTVSGRTVRAVPADGIPPQGYISGTEAAAACAASGKRLCTSTEWLAACRGPENRVFPYGDAHVDGACNDHYPGGHPVVDFFGTSTGVWDGVHMNDPGINQQPDTVAPGGAFADCASAWDVLDMHGNLHEWVDDPAGTFRGGFYADASINSSECLYVTTAHAIGYHDYSTGFRCCADVP
jgi:hypothetical protein